MHHLSGEEPHPERMSLKEYGVVASLYIASLRILKVLLGATKSCSTSKSTSSLRSTITEDLSTASSEQSPQRPPERLLACDDDQYKSLHDDFIRLSIWGKDFDADCGGLDEQLLHAEDVRKLLVLALMHLCDALYFGISNLTSTSETNAKLDVQSTERALEIARFVIDDDDYVQVDPSSIAEIAAEVAVAVEGLGDLSDYLCSSARYLRIQSEVPRTIRASVKARPYLVYEDGLCSRFKEAEPAAISQHAMANYCRFTTLQRLRNPEEDGGESLEHNKEQVKVQPSIAQETFRDSGIGTSHRHESSYAKSLIGLAKQTSEKFRELIPELSESQLSGNDFNCFMCTRQVRFFNHDEWISHVIEDLMPYVCIFPDCIVSTKPFENKTAWLNHLHQEHKVDLNQTNIQCNLCRGNLDIDTKSRIEHMENHLIVVALSVMPSDDDVEKDHFTLDEIYYMSKEGEFTQSSPIAAQNPEITPTQSVNWLDWIHDELPEPSRRLFSTPYQLQYPPEPMRRSYRDALVSEVEIPNPATADVTHGLYSNAFLPGDLKDFKNGSEAGATRASSLEVNIPNLAIPYELCGPYSNAFPPEDLKDFENGSEAAATVASSLEVNIPDPATADVLTCPKCQKTFRGKYRRGTLARHKRLKHGVYSKS